MSIFCLGAVSFSAAHFGVGIGQIYLDSVSCSGTEGRLIDCSRASSVFCYGGHSEDAGVRCQNRGLLICNTNTKEIIALLFLFSVWEHL